MTNRIWPIDAVNGAPAQPGRGLRQLQAPFLAGATADRPLGAASGVRPGTSPSTVRVTASEWSCAPHAGVLDLEAAAESGPYTYSIDETVTGRLDAANASNPRTDLIYVQMTDNSEDGTTPGQPGKVVVGYLAGTPGASAPVPATPPRSLVLGRVNVPRAGAGSPSVSWVGSFMASAGGTRSYLTVADLQAALPFASPGEVGYVLATDATYRRSNAGALRWVRLGGGSFVGNRSQLIGNGALSALGAFTRNNQFSDRDDFLTGGSITLAEGDYVVSLTMGLTIPSNGRTFVEIGGGGSSVRNAMPVGEDTITVSTPMHIPAGGESLVLRAYLQVSRGNDTPNFRLVISKVG